MGFREWGFTLTELVMVMTILAILSVVVVPHFHDFSKEAKEAITKDELAALRRGISGDIRNVSGGQYTFPGYESDMAATPNTLEDLVKNPTTGDKTQSYDPMIRRGWRGPYVDDSLGGYSKDGWNQAYVYDKAGRKIRSKGSNGNDETGGGDDLEINF